MSEKDFKEKLSQIRSQLAELDKLEIPQKKEDCEALFMSLYGENGPNRDYLARDLAKVERIREQARQYEAAAKSERERADFEEIQAYQNEVARAIEYKKHKLSRDIDYQNALRNAEKQELMRRIMEL